MDQTSHWAVQAGNKSDETRHTRNHGSHSAPLSDAVDRSGAGNGAGKKYRRDKKRIDERAFLHGPFSPPPRHAGSTDHRSHGTGRSAEHTSELKSLMRISYAVFSLNNKTRPVNQRIKNYPPPQAYPSINV